jgi:hypothetical protein
MDSGGGGNGGGGDDSEEIEFKPSDHSITTQTTAEVLVQTMAAQYYNTPSSFTFSEFRNSGGKLFVNGTEVTSGNTMINPNDTVKITPPPGYSGSGNPDDEDDGDDDNNYPGGDSGTGKPSGGDSGSTGNTGGTGSSNVGCGSLMDGTKCSAHSSCSNKFLCLTGQGSDSDCTTGCSCGG